MPVGQKPRWHTGPVDHLLIRALADIVNRRRTGKKIISFYKVKTRQRKIPQFRFVRVIKGRKNQPFSYLTLKYSK